MTTGAAVHMHEPVDPYAALEMVSEGIIDTKRNTAGIVLWIKSNTGTIAGL